MHPKAFGCRPSGAPNIGAELPGVGTPGYWLPPLRGSNTAGHTGPIDLRTPLSVTALPNRPCRVAKPDDTMQSGPPSDRRQPVSRLALALLAALGALPA